MKRWAPGLLLLAGCGGGWAEADTKASTHATRAQLMVEAICAPDAGCVPEQVRALERLAYCDNTSMLYRHGQPVPDGGISCQP